MLTLITIDGISLLKNRMVEERGSANINSSSWCFSLYNRMVEEEAVLTLRVVDGIFSI